MPAAGGSPGPTGAVLDRWPFVGRRVDLDTALGAVVDPRANGLVIAGAPGLGKTRLADELLAEAEAAGHLTASAVASSTVASVPLGALAHLLPPEVVLAETEGGALDAVRLLALARQAMAPTTGRLVLHVDDAHLLDAVSLTLLTHLVHDDAVALVLTVRTGVPVPDGLEALWRSERLRRIDLAPLAPDAVETLLHLALGGPLDGRASFALREVAGGNPLFLRELVRAADDDGSLRLVDGVWRLDGPLPHAQRVAELFDERLAAVAAESRTVLELLAAVGAVPLDLLSTVADFDVLEQLEADGLIELVVAGQAGDHDLVRLVHPLFAESLRRSLPALRWRSILVAHADRVEAWPGRGPDDALRVASWRLEAGQAVDPALLVTAAHLARVSEDFTLTLRLSQAAHRVQPSMVTGVLYGESLYELGRWEEAEAVLAGAVSLDGDTEARLQLLATRTTNLLFGLLRPDDALAIARAELDRLDHEGVGGTDGDTPDEATVRAELRSRVALLQMYGGEPGAALRTLGDPPPVDDLTSARTFALWANPGAPALALAGRTAEAAAVARKAYAVQSELGGSAGSSTLGVHLLTLCLALQEAGSFDEARELAVAGFEQSVEIGSPHGQTWFALNLGRIALAQGTARAGQRWFREALSVSAATGWLGPRAMALTGLAAFTAVVGDLDTARESLAAIESFPGRFDFLRPERCIGAAWYASADGRLADARAVLLEGADLAATSGHRTVEGWLAHEVVRLGGAPEVVDRLEDLAALTDSPLVAARAAHARAVVDGNATALTAAAERLEELGCLLAAGEAYAAAADLVRGAGDQRGANGLGVRSKACLDRCEGARSAVAVTVETVVPLTAREREIAVLAAGGVPSKEIAERLFLSVRTVNNHLQNAYTKLGVSSRAELAAVLDRRGGHDG